MDPQVVVRAPPAAAAHGQKRFWQLFSVLFNREWRVKTVALTVSCGLLFFSFSAWTSWFPSISVMIGYSVNATYVVLTMTSIAQVAGFFVGAFSADAIGRRRTIFITMPIVALANFASPFSSNIVQLGLASSVLCFSVNACTSALFSYVSENYPTAFRATATSAVRTIASVGFVVSPGTLGFLLSSYAGKTGIFWSYVLMGVTAIVVAIAIYPVKVETAGLSLEATSGEVA